MTRCHVQEGDIDAGLAIGIATGPAAARGNGTQLPEQRSSEMHGPLLHRGSGLMLYGWDQGKRQFNMEKHGIDFAAIEQFGWESATIFADQRKVNRYG